MTATLSDMTVPSWASHIEDKLAPMPLLVVQAYVDTADWDLGTDILAHADQARAWLAEAGLRDGRTASRALGYAQVLRFLDGQWSQEEAASQTVKATRRFARRQLSWFRRDPRITWLSADEPELAGRAMATIESCGLPRATERATTS